MSPDQFRDQTGFESGLSAGQTVEVRWTNSGQYFRAPAEVVRVNLSSIRVRLLEGVPNLLSLYGFGGYPVGHIITVPRLLGSLASLKRWSANNGVFSGKEGV